MKRYSSSERLRDSNQLDIHRGLMESLDAIEQAADDYNNIASILTAEAPPLTVKVDTASRVPFSIEHIAEGSSDEEKSDEMDDDTFSARSLKLFRRVIRRRSSLTTTDLSPPEQMKRNSVTTAVIKCVPPTSTSNGWDFTHILALSSISRLKQSKGLLRHFLDLLMACTSAFEPFSAHLLTSSPEASIPAGTLSAIQKCQLLSKYVMSNPIHPAGNGLIECINSLHSLIQGSKSRADDITPTLYQAESGMKVLASAVADQLTYFRELSADHPPSLAVVAKVNTTLEELMCKMEGTRRVNILVAIYASVLRDSRVIQHPVLPGCDSNLCDDYLAVKFSHILNPKRLLSPIVDWRWQEYLRAQEKAVLLILNQRKISGDSDRVAADIARCNQRSFKIPILTIF
jgi:hypothetical protein